MPPPPEAPPVLPFELPPPKTPPVLPFELNDTGLEFPPPPLPAERVLLVDPNVSDFFFNNQRLFRCRGRRWPAGGADGQSSVSVSARKG